MQKKDELPALELSLKEINDLVLNMEKGELNLEQSLQHFGRGIELIKHCQKILKEAEQKIQVLSLTDDQNELLPFKPVKDQED